MHISMRHDLLWSMALVLFLAAPIAAIADSPRVHVIVTQRAPVVDRLLLDIERAFAGRAQIRINDLKGSASGAKGVAQDVASSLANGDIVLALGAPAARAATEHIDSHPVVCAMTTSGAVTAPEIQNTKVFFAGGDPTVDSLVRALGSVFKNTGKVAVIAGKANPDAPRSVGETNLVWQQVKPGDDVLQTLDVLAGSVDGFVFPRESTVLNRRNIREVIDWLAREKKPAIGYSRFLVTAGFPAALGADDASARRRVISILKALLDGSGVPDEEQDGAIWLNRNSLQSLGIDPASLSVVAQLL